MKINQLLDGVNCYIEVKRISFSPDDLRNGDAFFLLKNDEKYLAAAIKKAVVIVTDVDVTSPIPLVKVDNARAALALACKRLSGNACDALKIIAITGTNGKTTTTYMLKSILDSAGKKTGLIGTNEIIIGNDRFPARLTTPDPPTLHAAFSKMRDNGIEYVVMEASAHALALDKLYAINFTAVAFTNFTQDHLDFFGDMNSYKRAKLKLFTYNADYAIVNGDESHFIADIHRDYKTYSVNQIRNLSLSPTKTSFDAAMGDTVMPVTIRLAGKYNAVNALCAITIAAALNIDNEYITDGLAALTHVDGRVNVIEHNGASIIIDFAHTPDGLSNLLLAMRALCTGKLIVVFGCGGNRDKTKRPLMGEAAMLADQIYLTADNPRNESVNEIIADIEKGIKARNFDNYYIYPDRSNAIAQAIKSARSGDCVVIAGKGNENYMEVNGTKYDYSDYAVVQSLIGANHA